jgi:hypothetical protein
MRHPVAILAFAATLALTGCVSVWTKVEQPLQMGPGDEYTVQIPTDWVRFTLRTDVVMVTRDGPPIQYLEVLRWPFAKAFEKTKKTPPPGILPQELAGLVEAELRAQERYANMRIVSIAPARIDRKPAFRMHVSYRTDRGAEFERMLVGAADGERLLLLSYNALKLHYFARDLPVFEQAVASYRTVSK